MELLTFNISDNSLVAPRDGRVQYRVARIGEVLPAGGKVLTLIDISYVYMDIYLPTLDAGQAKVGTEALIVLDAYPNIAIPAKVSFIATQSQFTPKTVETQTERDRLMFRIRVRIHPALLREHGKPCGADFQASRMCALIRRRNGLRGCSGPSDHERA